MKHFLILLIVFTALISCNKSEQYLNEEYKILSEKLNVPENVFDYTPRISEGVKFSFPDLSAMMENDPQRNHQATMGRVLFYDTRLSTTNEISCASCHDQSRAFSDNTRVSKGIHDKEGDRNALALAVTMGFELSYSGIGLGFSSSNAPSFFSWDDSVFNLNEQSRRAITSEVEMGMTMHDVVVRLSSDKMYGILCNNAFGTSAIEEHYILDALRVFINSLSSVDSKFDEGLAINQGNPIKAFQNFTLSENNGKAIFNRDCSTCHGELHSVSILPTANNGLDMSYVDKGKGGITGFESDMGVFKIPFLRNIELTAPYMHDGRFKNLEEVIEHYSSNIQAHPNLNESLHDSNGNPKKFNYSSQEKKDLEAYLQTLTDHKIINDVRFSDPFK